MANNGKALLMELEVHHYPCPTILGLEKSGEGGHSLLYGALGGDAQGES